MVQFIQGGDGILDWGADTGVVRYLLQRKKYLKGQIYKFLIFYEIIYIFRTFLKN
jgi:hypothetical protein